MQCHADRPAAAALCEAKRRGHRRGPILIIRNCPNERPSVVGESLRDGPHDVRGLSAVHVAACARAVGDAESEEHPALISAEDLVDEVAHVRERGAQIIGGPEGPVVVLRHHVVQLRGDALEHVEVGPARGDVPVHRGVRNDLRRPQLVAQRVRQVGQELGGLLGVEVFVVDVDPVEALVVHDGLELVCNVIGSAKAVLPTVVEAVPAATHTGTAEREQHLGPFGLPRLDEPRLRRVVADRHGRGDLARLVADVLARAPGVGHGERDGHFGVAPDLLDARARLPIPDEGDQFLARSGRWLRRRGALRRGNDCRLWAWHHHRSVGADAEVGVHVTRPPGLPVGTGRTLRISHRLVCTRPGFAIAAKSSTLLGRRARCGCRRD
mmetsp:Transcript_38587/g.120543  ORF Transcript_38587/g.120543 Transcript_38587/m.120543 type:complete len:381 (+) Transcript_38587:352-1494(+)